MPQTNVSESETGIFAILFRNPELFFSLKSVKSFMFSSEVNKTLFSSLIELTEQNIPLERNVLVSYLKSSNKLGLVGGETYIDFLFGYTENKDNLAIYEKQVVDSYITRTLIVDLNSVPQRLLSSNVDVRDEINRIRGVLDGLDTNMGDENTTGLGQELEYYTEELKNRLNTPGVVGIPFGLSDTDVLTGGMMPGEMWFIGSRPSMGKSMLMLNSVKNCAKQGNPCLVFSLEMRKPALIDRLIAIETGIPATDIRLGMLKEAQLKEISESIRYLKSLPIYVDTNFNADIDYVVSTTRKYHQKYGIKRISLDYIGLLSKRDDDQTAELGRFSRKIKLLCNDLGIVADVYSQLNRNVEMRTNKRPELSDLRQSGNLEEDADIVTFLYRDDYYYKEESKMPGTLEYIIKKNRNGPIGTIIYDVDLPTNRITSRS